MIHQALSNRIQKNKRKLKQWVNQFPTNAFRLYDRDLPDFPYIIDQYNQSLIIYEKGKRVEDEFSQKKKDIIQKSLVSLGFHESFLIFKSRVKQRANQQYLDSWIEKEITTIVQEGPAQFLIKPKAYIDQGLFLDHRYLRKQIYKQSSGLRVLNLFCYTGSFSVYADLGGAKKITSVDLSKTYIEWVKENLRLNQCALVNHELINQDCIGFLRNTQDFWDIIILDPPSFSNSKKTKTIIDIQRDHFGLINLCMKRLSNKGVLYFSTNKNKFQIDSRINSNEITHKTLPREFNQKYDIHKCFKINARNHL